MNFANELDSTARDYPEKVAVSDERRELTYRELADETDALAGALAESGVDGGERVALYMPGSTTFVAAYFGAMKLGAIPVPLNLRFDYHELDELIDEVGAQTVIGNEDLPTAPEALRADVIERRIVRGSDAGRSYEAMIEEATPIDEPVPREDDHLAEIVYTRGTTDEPRAVLHTHDNVWSNARALDRYLELSHRAVGLTACPAFHVFGLHGTVTPLVSAGATNHFPSEWGESVLELIEERAVTLTVLVPAMLKDVLEGYDGTRDLASLDRVVVAGGSVTAETLEEAESALGCSIGAMYGTTETMPVTALDRADGPDYEPGWVGRPAEEVVALRIEDPRDGTALGPGERGELLWRGATVTPGYWDPEVDAELFVQRDGERWLRSGDVGYVTDGVLSVEGRTEDLIRTDDGFLLAGDVEDALYGIEGALEAAVVASEEAARVVVMPEIDAESLDEEAVRDACRDVSGGDWVPPEVEFIRDLPRTVISSMNRRDVGRSDWFDRSDQGTTEPDPDVTG